MLSFPWLTSYQFCGSRSCCIDYPHIISCDLSVIPWLPLLVFHTFASMGRVPFIEKKKESIYEMFRLYGHLLQ